MRGSPPPATFLQRTAVFGGLNPRQIGKVRELLEERRFGPGEDICVEGDSAGEMYVLAEGEAVVLCRTSSGDSTILAQVGAGGCVGEMALLDVQPRSATVRTCTDCVVFVLSWDDMLSIYEWDLQTYTLLVMNIAREVSRRLRAADRMIAEFS